MKVATGLVRVALTMYRAGHKRDARAILSIALAMIRDELESKP